MKGLLGSFGALTRALTLSGLAVIALPLPAGAQETCADVGSRIGRSTLAHLSIEAMARPRAAGLGPGEPSEIARLVLDELHAASIAADFAGHVLDIASTGDLSDASISSALGAIDLAREHADASAIRRMLGEHQATDAPTRLDATIAEDGIEALVELSGLLGTARSLVARGCGSNPLTGRTVGARLPDHNRDAENSSW